MIRKLRSGQYRLYSRKIDPQTGRRRNLGTFKSRAAAEKHERAIQYFKRMRDRREAPRHLAAQIARCAHSGRTDMRVY